MMMMMMMMMTMENVVDDDDDDVDVMTTTAKQCSSKISKKKKRTTLLFLIIYQRVVLLRHDVFLRLSVYLSVCNSAFTKCVSLVWWKIFWGEKPLFLLLLVGQKKRSHIPTLLCLSLSCRTHTTYLFCLKRETSKRESVCVRVNDDDDEEKVSWAPSCSKTKGTTWMGKSCPCIRLEHRRRRRIVTITGRTTTRIRK